MVRQRDGTDELRPCDAASAAEDRGEDLHDPRRAALRRRRAHGELQLVVNDVLAMQDQVRPRLALIGFSFTNDEWNIAHSAGCVVWDYEKAEACDSPKSEASWDTYRLTRDNEIGCFSNVAEMLVESLTMAQQTVNWDQCKELASKAEMVYFAIADSKDGVTGKCVGGSTITDDYRGLSNTCLNICTEENKCTNADGSTSNTDSNGHHVGVGNLGEVYSVPATSMQPQPGSDFTCFSKSAQVATLDCSSKLKFADYHQVPGPAQ